MCPAYPADPERPQPPIGLRDEHSTSRPRSIRPLLDSGVQILKVVLQRLAVVPPRHAVDPRGRTRTNRPIRLPQSLDGNVVQERGEPRLPVLSRRLAHTVQIT